MKFKVKRKILLSIGSISAGLIPVSAVISCSPGSSMGEEESKFLEALKSKDGIRKINNLWLDKVLNNLYENKTADIKSDLKSYIKFFMAEEIRKDNNYLTQLNKTWSAVLSDKSFKTQRDELISNYRTTQAYHSFAEWKADFQNGKTFDNFINEYLFDKDKLGENYQVSTKTDFLLNIKKALVVKKYLQINKEKWVKVFGDDKEKEDLFDSSFASNKDVWNLIDSTKDFPLTLEGMRKHYAYSWNINVNDKTQVAKLLERKNGGAWVSPFDSTTNGTYVYTISPDGYNDIIFTITVSGNVSTSNKNDATININPGTIPGVTAALSGSNNQYTVAYDSTTDTASGSEIATSLDSMVAAGSKTIEGSWVSPFDSQTDGTYLYAIKADGYNDIIFTITVSGNGAIAAKTDATINIIAGTTTIPGVTAALSGSNNQYTVAYNSITDTASGSEIATSLKDLVSGDILKVGADKANTIMNQFKESKLLGSLSTFSDELNKATDTYSVLDWSATTGQEDWTKYVGYQGIKTMPEGKGILNFKWDDIDNWKNKTKETKFDGFVEKDRLLTDNDIVKYAEDGASEVNLNLWNGNGLIPTYDATDQKIKFRITDPNKKENLYWTLVNQNQTLYDKALQYYTNKENPILLELADTPNKKFLEKTLIDMGIKFIKTDD